MRIMLEVMNTAAAEFTCSAVDNALVLNCWDKPSPLIKELEQTVNFAERKCGDLMQQLHFYKEYYEKWAQSERGNVFPKKKIKKGCKNFFDTGSSSENEFEKVNQYFYRKIRSKITEMNNEISEANKRLCTQPDKPYTSNTKGPKTSSEDEHMREIYEHLENDTEEPNNTLSTSKPITVVVNKEPKPPNNNDTGQLLKITENQSSDPPSGRNKPIKKRDIEFTKNRHSSLQRYKIRSKSLPKGVRRKFGFGGFIEVFDPNARTPRVEKKTKSRTSLRTTSSKSSKSRKSISKFKAKSVDCGSGYTYRNKRSSPKSSRSSIRPISKSKTDITVEPKNYFSEGVKSESTFIRTGDKIVINTDKFMKKQSVVPKNETIQKTENAINCKAMVATSRSEKTNNLDKELKKDITTMENITHLISKPNSLIPFIRRPIPFIPCSSTTKSFNLGLNVQQVLSLIKHKRHSVTLQTIVKNSMQAARTEHNKTEPTVNTLIISQMTTSHSHVTSALCPAQEDCDDSVSVVSHNRAFHKCNMLRDCRSESSFSNDDKLTVKNVNVYSKKGSKEPFKIERPEDVWAVEQPDSTNHDLKKIKRCTCFPSKHCVDYHKVLRQYTDWRMPGTKANSFTTDCYSSYHPMLSCAKSKLYPIPSQENMDYALSDNSGRFEVAKVHNDLLTLNRKYSCLQEQIQQNSLDDYEANAELDAMESELALRELEFKDIMNFYNEMMLLKDKLKALRVKNGQSVSQSTIGQPQYQRPKKDPFRPTPSMALTKVLRKIQGLQDKIKLIDTP